MKHFTLFRVVQNNGITGVLVYDNAVVCLTLEPDWNNNKKNKSCIPEGEYICNKVTGANVSTGSHKHTFKVENVTGRTSILFHIGNTIKDTAGCILTGETPGLINGRTAVINSGKAFNRFINTAGEDDMFYLHIINLFNQ